MLLKVTQQHIPLITPPKPSQFLHNILLYTTVYTLNSTDSLHNTNPCVHVHSLYISAMLQEDAVETGAWWGKTGGAAQVMVEEEEEGDFTDYSPTQAKKGRASSPKKTKQVQEGGSSHPSRKKIGGPCVSCHVASKLLVAAAASICV